MYNKYRNTKVYENGIKVADSKKEGKRRQELLLLQRGGIITDLQTQVKFELQPSYKIDNKTIQAINYIADFTYYDELGRFVVEDCKGFKTDVYKLKKKLFEYKYKTKIKEI